MSFWFCSCFLFLHPNTVFSSEATLILATYGHTSQPANRPTSQPANEPTPATQPTPVNQPVNQPKTVWQDLHEQDTLQSAGANLHPFTPLFDLQLVKRITIEGVISIFGAGQSHCVKNCKAGPRQS